MEDFKYAIIPEFDDNPIAGVYCDVNSLRSITEQINNCFKNTQEDFKGLCYWLHELCELFKSDKSYYHGFDTKRGRENGFYKRYTFDNYCSEFIGLDEKYVYRCIQCYEKFIESDKSHDVATFHYRQGYEYFSKSKLFELLSISVDTLDKSIACGELSWSMTVKQIREYVKSVKGKSTKQAVYEDSSNSDEESEQQIFDVSTIDISKYYDAEFFQGLDKVSLITLCLMYQEKYVKN